MVKFLQMFIKCTNVALAGNGNLFMECVNNVEINLKVK